MSFGLSPSDVVTVVAIVTRAYRGWNKACGEYSDITVSLNEIRVLLQRIEDESRSDHSVLVRNKSDAEQLKVVLAGVQGTAEELDEIIEKYKRLSSDRSRERNWGRLQRQWARLSFGYVNLDGTRNKLSQHVGAITSYLEAVGLGSLSRIEQHLQALPAIMKRTMDNMRAEIQAGKREGTVMTAFTDDDPHMWKEFRRELVGEGFTSSEIHKFKPRIKQCLQQWAAEGLLEERAPLVEESDEAGSAADPKSTAPVQKSASNVRRGDEARNRPFADARSLTIPRAMYLKKEGSLSSSSVESRDTSRRNEYVRTMNRISRNTSHGDPREPVNAFAKGSSMISRLGIQRGQETQTTLSGLVVSYTGDASARRAKCRVSDLPESCNRLKLHKSKTTAGDIAFCTVIVIVPAGDFQAFARFASDSRPLLPDLEQRLRDEGEFQSVVVMGIENLFALGSENLPLSNFERDSEDLGIINGAQVYFSQCPIIFDKILERYEDITGAETDITTLTRPTDITIESLVAWFGSVWAHTAYNYYGPSQEAVLSQIGIDNGWTRFYRIQVDRKRDMRDAESVFSASVVEGDIVDPTVHYLLKAIRSTNAQVVENFMKLRARQQEVAICLMLGLAAIGYARNVRWRLVEVEVFDVEDDGAVDLRKFDIVLEGLMKAG